MTKIKLVKALLKPLNKIIKTTNEMTKPNTGKIIELLLSISVPAVLKLKYHNKQLAIIEIETELRIPIKFFMSIFNLRVTKKLLKLVS